MRTIIRLALMGSLGCALLCAQHSGGGHAGGGAGYYGAGAPRSGIAPSGAAQALSQIVPSGVAQSFGPVGHSYGSYGGGYHGPYSNKYYSNSNYYSNNNRNNRRYPFYPYYFTPYYYPFLDSSSEPYYADYYGGAADPGAQDALVAQNLLGEQIQNLTAEVEQLRAAQGGSMAPYPAPSYQHQDPVPPAPPVAVVLQNGQTLTVQNYAVMGNTFWDFSSQPARKIPVAQINVVASTKATEALGGEFPSLTAP